MKNILITGGAGKIGINLVKRLVDNKEYNLTVLDYKSNRSVNQLKPFKDKIEIIYGDINDHNILRKLIRKNDLVFHLASVTPPLANSYNELCEYINLLGTEHVCDTINSYNPNCKLIYLSSIIPKDISNISDNYTKNNIKIEDYIKKNVEKYIIVRLQPVIFLKKNLWINAGLNTPIQLINIDSTINLLISLINSSKYINRIIIGHGSDKFITTYAEHINKMQLINKFKYQRFNNDRGYLTDIYHDVEKYHSGSLDDYYEESDKK